MSNRKSRVLIALFCSLFMLQSCNDKPVDRNSYVKQQKNRELKVVSKVDIHAAGLAKGQELVKLLEQELNNQIRQDSTQSSLMKNCDLTSLALTDSLQNAEQVSIKLVSLRSKSGVTQPDSLEYLFLDSYAYSQGGGAELFDAVQEAEQGFLIYTKPVFFKDSPCLQPQDLNVMASDGTYTPDSLWGMWSVRLSVKELVQDL